MTLFTNVKVKSQQIDANGGHMENSYCWLMRYCHQKKVFINIHSNISFHISVFYTYIL